MIGRSSSQNCYLKPEKSYFTSGVLKFLTSISTDLESQGINLVRENLEVLLVVGENDVYRPSCVTVVYCCNSVSGLKFDSCLLRFKCTFTACLNRMLMERISV